VPENIILLTNESVANCLASALMNHRSRLNAINAVTLKDLKALRPRLLHKSRLIAFGTPVIVPPEFLDALGFGAYNFHPGPPEYRGWAPCSFAVYDGVSSFGATAHIMVAKVDSGPIVGAQLFPVASSITGKELEKQVLIAMTLLFKRLARFLVYGVGDLAPLPIKWGARKTTRADFAAMCDMPGDISEAEKHRRLNAFALDGADFPVPTITVNGIKVRLETSCASEWTSRNTVDRYAKFGTEHLTRAASRIESVGTNVVQISAHFPHSDKQAA
jgi:methionyl-tRNA formyltransferase